MFFAFVENLHLFQFTKEVGKRLEGTENFAVGIFIVISIVSNNQ